MSREDIVAGLTVFAILASFVAIFVVASTFSLSVQQRHRELALFRAIGSTPRQVRRLVAGEAFVISVVAVLLALPVSLAAAFLEKGLFVRAGMIPSGLHVVVGWLPVLAGLGTAIVTTQLAAFVSARRASRIRPTDALREANVQARPISWLRAVTGLAAFLGGIAVVLLAARNAGGLHESDAPAAAMLLMVAAALLGPLLAWPFAWLVGRPLAARRSAPGLLAWANTRTSLRRTASVATPLMLAISVVSSLFIAKSILHKETHAQTAKRTTAAFVLRAHQTRGLSTEVAAAARRLHGVASASGTIATSVVVAADGQNLRPFPARTVDAGSAGRVLDLGLVSGSLADLRGNAVAVSTQSAREWGWKTGDRVHVWLGDGTPATLRVVAQYTRPLGFGDVVLPRKLVEGHVTQPLDDAVFVAGKPGVRPTELERQLRTLRAADPTIAVVSRSDYETTIDRAAEKQSLAVYVLLGLIVVFCALALVNALTMAIGERAREFAMLRLIGATKRQVRAMIRTETAIMVAFGLTAGSLIAAPGLALAQPQSDRLTRPGSPAVGLDLPAHVLRGSRVRGDGGPHAFVAAHESGCGHRASGVKADCCRLANAFGFGSILGRRRLLSPARESTAVAPERSRRGTSSAGQIGAGMASPYAVPAIATSVPERLQPSPSVLRAIALAGLLIAGCSLAFALTNDGITGVQVALLEWISLPYIAAGLVAWWRRPDSRLGVLMIVGGFATGLSGLAFAGYALPHTLGLVFDILPVGHLPARLPRVPRRAAAVALRASARRGRVRVGDRSPARQDVARRGRRRRTCSKSRREPAAAHTLEQVQLLCDQRALPGRARRARRATASHGHGRCAVRSALLIDSFALGLVMIAVLFVFAAFEEPGFQPIQRATLVGDRHLAVRIPDRAPRRAACSIVGRRSLRRAARGSVAGGSAGRARAGASRSVVDARVLAARVRELGGSRRSAGQAARTRRVEERRR